MLAARTTLDRRRWVWVVRFLTTFAALGLMACNNDDVGTCCEALDEETRAKIPEPDEAGGDRIRQDPRFDCSGLTCISTAGSPTYCSRPCQENDDCPDGFRCEPVLQSDPGPGSMIGPDDRFCVTATPECQMSSSEP